MATATICLGPNVAAYDPATDSAFTSWRLVKQDTKALKFDDVDEEGDAGPPEKRTIAFLFLGEDLVTSDNVELKGDQDGLIDCDGLSYEITRCESDPTGTVWIFYGRQNGVAEPRAVYLPPTPPPAPPIIGPPPGP